jgi:SAM-dependent methyltransferase
MAGGRICDLCGSSAYEVICRRDRRGKPLSTVACLGCGLVGHEHIPSEAELAAFYARDYRKDYHGEETPSPRRVWRAWRKGERLLCELGPHLQPGDRILEVGAGLGCNVRVLELAGFDASGLEPGDSFQRYSQEQLRARVHHGSLHDYEPQQRFHLVLFVHVIEHMRSPRQALEAIHRLLLPGGRLYLECPSLGTLCGNVSEQLHYAHVHTFTPITLLTLLRQCGFVVERCYGEGVGGNHKYLLTKTEPAACGPDPAGLAQTREFLATFQAPGHRLSFSYFTRRVKRISQYVREFMWGRVALRRILRIAQAA